MTLNTSRRRSPHTRLQKLRIDHGMSPNDLARRAGVSGDSVRLAERGHVPSPRVQFAIAAVFDMKPTELWPLDRQRVTG